jgi:hypothetical protein
MTILDILPYEITLSPVVGADSVRIRIKRLRGIAIVASDTEPMNIDTALHFLKSPHGVDEDRYPQD